MFDPAPGASAGRADDRAPIGLARLDGLGPLLSIVQLPRAAYRWAPIGVDAAAEGGSRPRSLLSQPPNFADNRARSGSRNAVAPARLGLSTLEPALVSGAGRCQWPGRCKFRLRSTSSQTSLLPRSATSVIDR